jgi:1,4-dihydroxy-2-naphthoyl-CoA synthase
MSFYLKAFEDLIVEKIHHSLWITLNRPEASNAYSISMVKALVEVLKFADIDNEIRVIVITGAGKISAQVVILKQCEERQECLLVSPMSFVKLIRQAYSKYL